MAGFFIPSGEQILWISQESSPEELTHQADTQSLTPWPLDSMIDGEFAVAAVL